MQVNGPPRRFHVTVGEPRYATRFLSTSLDMDGFDL
jgi:hypothetical protein